jgi:hypothetical protein
VGNVTDLNNGSYRVAYRLPASGAFYLSVFFFQDTVGNNSVIVTGYSGTLGRRAPVGPGARLLTCCGPWPATSPAASIAYGDGITSCKARVTCRFVVQALDAYGTANPAGDTVAVLIDGEPVRGRAVPQPPVRSALTGMHVVPL